MLIERADVIATSPGRSCTRSSPACTAATDVSPLGRAAAHLGQAPHNFGIQEYMVHSRPTREVFGPTREFAHGGLRPSEEPGLGIHLDEDLAAAYPCERAYLPVNRLRDGTVDR